MWQNAASLTFLWHSRWFFDVTRLCEVEWDSLQKFPFSSMLEVANCFIRHMPCADSGVVRIDLVLAGCRTRRLNQVLFCFIS